MNVEEFRNLAPRRRKNKYGARKTGGHASRKEHGRAGQLRVMEHAGLISDLREQVSFTLVPAQRDAEGNLLEHSCRYIADFVYNDKDGNQVVEDTKGYRTPEYIIKRKLMLMIYGIRIIEK